MKRWRDVATLLKYPITFVIKSADSIPEIKERIEAEALKTYPVKSIIKKYLDCIEEIINIPTLIQYLQSAEQKGLLLQILDEMT